MSGKINLFDDNSDEDEENETLKINQSYADRYQEWREAELKRQLEDRYGNASEDVSSSSSDDDEDPQALKQVLSKDFFEVISSLKTKDPKIYNSEVKFFQNEKAEVQGEVPKKKEGKNKPMYLREYERKLIIERGGQLSDDDSDIDVKNDERAQSPSYVEEQRQLKESFKKALNDPDSDDEGGLFTKKDQTKEEKEKEDDDYIEWLKGQRESLADKETEKSLKPLQKLWNDPKLDEGEKFLRDYILNKKYLDNDDEPLDTGNVSEDDYQDEYMNNFERKFNFRYEEPDKEFLKRYPRTMEQSMRKKDTRRKERREAVKQRKEEEKQKKREELKLLKSLKRKEIMKKIEKIKSITGNDELGLNADELEEDFDPEAHDRKMKELFNDDYYGDADEAEGDDGLNLPPLEDELMDDYVNWDDWDGTDRNEYPAQDEENSQGVTDNEAHCEDPDFNMDCDYDPAAEHLRCEEKSAGRQSSREKRKLKRQSRFGRLVRKEKPVFDPQDKSFQEYVDEYYGMDYEDLIGDIPCRFKYKSVAPNSFGLTIEEILAADDKELNQWASIKKAYTIRPDAVEKYEAKVYAQKAQDEELKRKILPSLYKHETKNENQSEGKRKKKKNKVQNELDTAAVSRDNDEPNLEMSKKRKRKMDADESTGTVVCQQDAPGHAEGSTKKKKNKGNSEHNTDAVPSSNHEPIVEETKTKKRKMNSDDTVDEQSTGIKKKKKNKGNKEHARDAVPGTNKPNIKPDKKKKKKIGTDETAGEAVGHLDTTKHTESSKKQKKKNNQSPAAPLSNQIGKRAGKNLGQEAGAKKKFKKWNDKSQDGKRKQESDLSDERLKAYGIHPKRYRNKLRYGPAK